MSRPLKEQHLELVVLALGILATTGLLFFIAGETLTYLATGEATGTSVFSALGLVLGVLAHPGAPALAWPDDSRAVFNPAVFWIFSLILIAATLMLLRRLGLRWGRVIGRHQRPESARWATSTDIRQLFVSKNEPGRVTLGKLGNKRVATEPTVSTLVLGPPGSMKTTSLITPIINQWEGPVIATSVKTDVLDDTIAVRRQKGEVMIFDPAAAVGSYRRNTWSPLARCGTWAESLKTATALVTSAKQATGGSGENEIWYQSAQKLLAPCLFAAAVSEQDIGVVLDWLDAQDTDQVRQEITECVKGEDAARALKSLQGIIELGPEQRSSIFFTAITTVEAYRTPSVLDSARTSEIHPDKLFDGKKGTLYVCAPPHEQKALRSPFGTLVLSFLNYAYDYHVQTGKMLDPPLLIAADELANIAPIEDLDEFVNTARGVGIVFVSVFQDVGQIRHRWGESRAQSILSGHLSKIVLPGIADQHTLEWLGRISGDQEIRQVSYTDGHASKSSTDSTSFRQLLPANLVRQQKRGHGLLIYGNLPPVRLQLLPWFADPPMRKLIEEAKKNDPQRFDPTTPRSEWDRPIDQGERETALVRTKGKPKRLRIQHLRKLVNRDELAEAVLRVAAESNPHDAYKALEAIASVTADETYRALSQGRKPIPVFGRRRSQEFLALYTLDMQRQVMPAVYAQTDALWPSLAPAGVDTPEPGQRTDEDRNAQQIEELRAANPGLIIDPETGEVLARRASEPPAASTSAPTAVAEPPRKTPTYPSQAQEELFADPPAESEIYPEQDDLRAGEVEGGGWEDSGEFDA